jgi:hypothetical protein
MKRPPPPGPPGTYLRFLKGGPSGESTAWRDAFKADLGWVLDDLPEKECRDIGAIVHIELGELRGLIDVEFGDCQSRHVRSRSRGRGATR